MTVWEHLVANSTLNEADGDAWEHLTHPSGTGGMSSINLNTELIHITGINDVLIGIDDQVTPLLVGDDSTVIVKIDENIGIITEKENEINGVC